jgi:hypothetical protein
VYQHPEWYDAEPEAMQIHRMLRTARNKPKAKLTVYRAIPKGIKSGINLGDWITLSRKYAALHGQKVFGAKNYQILKATIPAEFIWFDGNSILESGFDNSIKNGTHIHAENIDHLDVSRVHNPDANRNKAAYYTLLDIYGGKANIPTLSYFLRDVKTADQDYRRIMGGASPPTLRALNMDPGPGSTTDDTLSMVKARYHEIENTLGHYSALSDMHDVSQMLLTDAHMAESRLSDVMEENPARPVTRYEYTLGTWWQPYIAYGDDSDVSIAEIQQWEAFRKRLPPGGHWSFTEDTYFGKDEITGKRGDVSDAYYVIVG